MNKYSFGFKFLDLKKLIIVEISPWNSGFSVSLFVPDIVKLKSSFLIIKAPKILLPLETDILVSGISLFKNRSRMLSYFKIDTKTLYIKKFDFDKKKDPAS